eukprot:CAMPEP_0117684856 /NCGR_PEP_ID=MMETSP0804-20121206/21378_1 /TAXON_ID=1074897 /ORGANISM="Tetraselmis astigmatica, Strain CCMP880" /LENGTH=38 /DNA_ID= /DNA_START= /DNA_END= /DNA_ORIENTATION=
MPAPWYFGWGRGATCQVHSRHADHGTKLTFPKALLGLS